jgi:hypothetical protein
MALLLETLGHRDDAIGELERAIEENSATLYMLDVDPKIASLRTDLRFGPLRNKLFGPTRWNTAAIRKNGNS